MNFRIAAALAAFALTGCTESALNPDDPVTMKGLALNEDKTPMKDVELALARSANNLCVPMVPLAALKTGADGAFTHNLVGKDTQTDSDLARCFTLSLPTQTDGSGATHDFFIQVTDVKVPDLQLWSGGVTVAQTADGATFTYKGIADTHTGVNTPTTSFVLIATDGAPANNLWWKGAATSPITLSDYVLEDLTTLKGQVHTRAETKGSGTTFHTVWGSSSVAMVGHNKRPVSRGVPCVFGEAVACKITDGKPEDQTTPDNTFEARINLPAAKILKKAVFRGFEVGANFKNIVIEGSADGATFSQVAQITDPEKIRSQYYEVDLTMTTAMTSFRIKGVDQSDQPLRLTRAREISLFE